MSNCRIKFPEGVQDKTHLSNSAKLVSANVVMKDGLESKVYKSLKKTPLFGNLEGVYKTYIAVENAVDKTYAKMDSQPSLIFKGSDGEIYTSYKEALKNSKGTFIEAGLEGKEGGFTPLMRVNTLSNVNTRQGTVNFGIKEGLLSGEVTYEINGDVLYELEGENSTEQMVNGMLLRRSANTPVGGVRLTFNSQGQVKIVENPINATVLVDEDGNEVKSKDVVENYDKYASKYGHRMASKTAVDYYFASGEFGRFLSRFPSLKVDSDKELGEKLFSILRETGISVMTVSEYQERYKTLNGTEMDAKALADLANGVIALGQGASFKDLAEEISHFAVESMNFQEIKDIINSEEFKSLPEYDAIYAEYHDIYSRQGLSGEELDTKVKKEILGKAIANGFIEKYAQRQNEGFVKRVFDAIKNFLGKVTNLFTDNGGTLLDGFIDSITNKMMSEDVDSFINRRLISENASQLSNAIYFSSSDTKRSLVKLQNTLDVLEERYKRIINSNITDVDTYRTHVNEARKSLDLNNAKHSVELVYAMAENMVNKLNKDIEQSLKSNGKPSPLIVAELNTLEESLLPGLRAFTNSNSDDIFTKDERDVLDKKIKDLSVKHLQNKLNAEKVVSRNVDEITEDILSKYGITSEVAREHFKAMIAGAIQDINVFTEWVGTAEHSSIPQIALFSRIIGANNARVARETNKLSRDIANLAQKHRFTQADYDSLIFKDADGNFTGYMISDIDEARAKKEYDAAILKSLNEIVHGNNTDAYVDEATYKKEGLRVFKLDDNQRRQFAERKNNIDSEFKETPYIKEVYDKANNIYKALGLGQTAIDLLRSYSAMRRNIMSAFLDANGELDYSKLEANEKALKELQDLANERNALGSLQNTVTGEIYGVIDESDLETISVDYVEKGKTKTITVEIPKIKLDSKFQNQVDQDPSLKQAIDMTRMRLFNKARFEQENRQISENYFKELDRLENWYAQRNGFKDYEDLKKKVAKGSDKWEDLHKGLNDLLVRFSRVHGGFVFNEDFYQGLSNGSTPFKEALNILSSDSRVPLTVQESATQLLSNMEERSNILRQYRNKLNPAEIDGDELSMVEKMRVAELDRSIRQGRKNLKRDIANELTQDDLDDMGINFNQDFDEDFSSYELNSSFYSEAKQEGLSPMDYLLKWVNDPAEKALVTDLRDILEGSATGVSKSVTSYLYRKGLIDSYGIKTDKGQEVLDDPDLYEKTLKGYYVRYMPSYFMRFSPANYDKYKKDLQEGVYRDKDGHNSSFAQFLRNSANRQLGNPHSFIHPVEKFMDVKPSLQYTDGEEVSFADQVNPDYDTTNFNGGVQWKRSKFQNEDFFRLFPTVDKKKYLSLKPNERVEYLRTLGKNNPKLALYVMLGDINAKSYDMNNVTKTHSRNKIPQVRKAGVEAFQQSVTDPKKAAQSFITENFKYNVDTQDTGAKLEGVRESLGDDYRSIPKFGVHDLEDIDNVSRDLFNSAMYLLENAVHYKAKQESLSDINELESLLAENTFENGIDGRRSKAMTMFKELKNSYIYGVKKIGDLQMGNIDMSRIVMKLSSVVGTLNTAYSPVIAATSLTSSTLFSFIEGMSGRHFDARDWGRAAKLAAASVPKSLTEAGHFMRNDKSYKILRMLGAEGYSLFNATKDSGHNRKLAKVMDAQGYTLTEMATEPTRLAFGNLAVISTRYYKGRWVGKGEFTQLKTLEGMAIQDVNNAWATTPTLMEHIDFDEDGNMKFTDKAVKMMEADIKKENPNITQAELKAEMDKRLIDTHVNVSNRLISIMQDFEGSLNTENKPKLARHWLGRTILTNSTWLVNALQKWFKSTHYNAVTNSYEVGQFEGLATTARNFFRMKRYGGNVTYSFSSSQQKIIDNLIANGASDEVVNAAKESMRRANKEAHLRFMGETIAWMGGIGVAAALAQAIADDDEEEMSWWSQLAAFIFIRTVSETGGAGMIIGTTSLLQKYQQPTATMTPIIDFFNMLKSNPLSEVESGPYKGYNQLTKYIMKMTPYRQVVSHSDLRDAIKSYMHYNSLSLFGAKFKKSEDDN